MPERRRRRSPPRATSHRPSPEGSPRSTAAPRSRRRLLPDAPCDQAWINAQSPRPVQFGLGECASTGPHESPGGPERQDRVVRMAASVVEEPAVLVSDRDRAVLDPALSIGLLLHVPLQACLEGGGVFAEPPEEPPYAGGEPGVRSAQQRPGPA